ncbi:MULTISPECIES: S-layer homology domain-containing protein [Bacillus cereus group]|uniref:S-layer homology domain-containing protein n=1 Tax=Bacillus cereus group TaxID=86661 RepID=UPI0008FD4F3E|nr:MULTISPECIES: S-layer homology domain-containing protein [unclassified Bacillus cereus group]MDA1560526.1 S-layer homology domain-containing protein [Bacillus cereus group sp. TH243-1LC]MDA1637379.1 S-layer homology domain-containing protein [Bacillus cereus group sp. TH177-1LC]MDA1654643.1 S-layer homology domain-containing protein [Bacillus cereus group sp. TH150LC]MDA1856643.1 S-layer homology domain-containing protein [Bacillus cereus group sp. BY122LC]
MAKTNSYKKVIAGTMTAAMVAGVVSPVAAAGKTFPDVQPGSWSAEYIDYLVAKKAIEGKPDGTFAPTEAIDRASAAKIMAITLGLEVKDGAKPTFKDAQDSWAAKYIAAVEKAGVIQGDGTGNFNPNNQINRASMASMIVKAYKLDGKVSGQLETKFSDLNDHWGEKDANILVALGITNGTGNGWEPDKSVTRAEAAKFIAKTDMQFGQKAEAKVESIKAINAKEIEVKFGTEVKDVTAANFAVVEGSKELDIEKVELSEDKKSATITLKNALVNKQAYVAHVKDVKSVDGKDIPKALEVIFFNDEVAPTVSTVSTPDGNVKVVFSEKLSKDAVTVVIDGKEFTATPEDNTVTLTKADVASVVKNGEAFNVIVTGAKDLVGNTMEMYEGKATYKVEKDVTAPEVKDIKVKELVDGVATLEVTFSEELSAEGKVVVKKGDKVVDGATIVLDQDTTKALVTVPEALTDKETAANLKVEFVGYKDAANNVGTKVTKEVKVTKDVVAPNLVKVEADENKAATFTFDKEVTAQEGKLRVINLDTSKDVTKEVAVAPVEDNKKAITLTFPEKGNYKVAATKGFVKDTAGNESAAFTKEVKVVEKKEEGKKDEVAPKATKVERVANSKTKFTVTFDKEVKGGQGADSASNVNNYTLAGAKLPEGTLIVVNADGKSVTIELPETFTFEKSETVKFTVANVANKDGVKMGTTNLLVNVVDTKAPEFKSAKITKVDAKEITLTFSEAVNVDTSDFTVDLNGVALTVAKADEKAEAAKEVVLKVTAPANVNLATGTVTVKAKELENNAKYEFKTTDKAGNALVAFKSVTATR